MKSVLAAIALILLTGCATVMQGTTQLITFQVDPREARCVMTHVERGEIGSFVGPSANVTVSKSKDDIVVTCAAPGYANHVSRVVSAASGGGVASIFLFDFGITDLVTGAYWIYPSVHSISMNRDGAAPAPLTPALGSPPPVPAAAQSEPPATGGKFVFYVDRLAREERCTNAPRSAMTSSGPGFEIYSVPCANGDALTVRCDQGNCRALR